MPCTDLVSVYANYGVSQDSQPRAERNEERKPVVSLLHTEVLKQQWAPVLPGINTSNLEIKEQKLREGSTLSQLHSRKQWGGVTHVFNISSEFWGEPWHSGQRLSADGSHMCDLGKPFPHCQSNQFPHPGDRGCKGWVKIWLWTGLVKSQELHRWGEWRRGRVAVKY